MKRDLRLSAIKVIGLALGFSLQLFFTRIVGVEAYGVYILFSTWTSIFSLIIILGYDKMIIKELSYLFIQNEKRKFRAVLDKMLIFVFINTIIFLIIAFLIPQGILVTTFFSKTLLRSTWLLIALGSVVYTAFALLGKVLSATQRVELTYIRSEIIYKLVWLGSVVLLYYYFKVVVGTNIIVVGAVGAYTFTVLVFFILVDRKKISEYLKIKKEKIKLGRENYVFFLLTFNYYFIAQIDKVVLGKFESMQTLGVYGLASTLCGLIGFSSIIYQRFLPKISNYIITDKIDKLSVEFKIVVRNALLIALPLMAFIIVFAEDILLFFGQKYVAGAVILRILILGQVINYYTGPNGSLLINGKHSKIDFYNSCLVLIITIILNYFGYKLYGVIGVAAATSIGVTLINVVKVIEVKIFYKIFPYEWHNIIMSLVVLLCFYSIKMINIDIHNLLGKLSVNFGLSLFASVLAIVILNIVQGKKINNLRYLIGFQN